MGVIQEIEGQIVPVSTGAWEYIGTKLLEDGTVLGTPDPYIHVNFRTVHDLRAKALGAAQAGDADIASGLAEIAAYFITDAEGNVSTPANPMRLFW